MAGHYGSSLPDCNSSIVPRHGGYRADVAFDGERVMADGALVLVRDGMIIGVEPASAAVPDGCPVTYLPGTTLLPGLIDAHSHLCGNDGPDALDRLPGLSAYEIDQTVEAALAAQLAAGVTAVRDLGDHRWAVVDRHRDRPAGPTVVAAGPPIISAGGHCAAMGGGASGVEGLRAAVGERAERGADLIKIMTSGGVMTRGTDIRACQFSLEELRAVVDEAHRLGLPVTATPMPWTAMEQCVAAGVDGIEHCSFTEQGMRTPPVSRPRSPRPASRSARRWATTWTRWPRCRRLRAGLHADLLLVGGDPTTDITALRDTRVVVSRGRVA